MYGARSLHFLGAAIWSPKHGFHHDLSHAEYHLAGVRPLCKELCWLSCFSARSRKVPRITGGASGSAVFGGFKYDPSTVYRRRLSISRAACLLLRKGRRDRGWLSARLSRCAAGMWRDTNVLAHRTSGESTTQRAEKRVTRTTVSGQRWRRTRMGQQQMMGNPCKLEKEGRSSDIPNWRQHGPC